MVYERRVKDRNRRTFINCVGVIFILFGFGVGNAGQGVADTLNLECDTLFKVNQSQAVNKQIVADSFPSYWLTIDWNKNNPTQIFIAPGSQNVWETYTLNSDKEADLIDLELGKPVGSPWAPIQFLIKRSSGWFWKTYGLDKDHPSVYWIDVGVCGGPHRF
jgi:hypothetical protein